MTDPDTPAEETAPGGKPVRKRRDRPSRSAQQSRLERRAQKVRETISEAVKWRLKDQDQKTDLDFVHTVRRDADGIGHAVAAVGEHVLPFGTLIDLLFGETGPLAIFVALAPSIRAGRREAIAKIADRRARKREQAEETRAEADDVTTIGATPDNPPWPGDNSAGGADPLADPALDITA